MAWVQAGKHKINTANVCYIEQKEDGLLVHFHGQWQGNPLALSGSDAAGLWKHVKSEDVNAVKDKGSTMVVPKRVNTPMAPDLLDGKAAAPAAAAASPEKPKVPAAGIVSPSQHRQPSSHSGSHGQSHSAPRPVGEVRKA